MKTSLLFLFIILTSVYNLSEDSLAQNTPNTPGIGIHHEKGDSKENIKILYKSPADRHLTGKLSINSKDASIHMNKSGNEDDCTDGADYFKQKYNLSSFNRLKNIKDSSNHIHFYSEIITPLVYKTQFTENVLDSIIYTQECKNYKNYFTYNENAKILIYLQRYLDTSRAEWVNDLHKTCTYDDNWNLLTELYEYWDSNSGNWVCGSRYTYTYDGDGNLLTELHDFWDNDNLIWLNFWRYTYTYDESGNKLTELWEDWDRNAGIWVGWWYYTYTYDNTGALLILISEHYDNDAQIWEKVLREKWTYDDSGNILTYLAERWDDNANVWANNIRGTYTYDSSGKLLTVLAEKWDVNANIWNKTIQRTHTYDNSGNLLTLLSERWDRLAGIWVNDSRWTYTYNVSGNLLTDLLEYWDIFAGEWFNDSRKTKTYDGNGNMLTELSEYWGSGDNIWINDSYMTYAYDASGNLVHFTNETWNSSGWIASDGACIFSTGGYEYFYHCQELFAYYSPLTTIDDSENHVLQSYCLFQNYPNPFNPKTVISWQLPVGGEVDLTVYNLLGQKVATLVSEKLPAGNHEVEFNGQNLSSGVYLYKIEAGAWQDVKKLVYLK